MFPGNRAQKNVQRIKTVPAGRGHAAAPLSVTTSLSLCLPSSAQQAEDEEIPDDGGVASFPHVLLHALNLHLKHGTVQTRSVPAVIAAPALTASPVTSAGSVSPHPARSSALWFLYWDTLKAVSSVNIRQTSDLQKLTCAGSSSD